jgi:hypothetical protein
MKLLVAILAVVAGVGLGNPARAQPSCYQEVLQAANNPGMRVQSASGGLSDTTRDNARLHLWRALRAAEQGDEAECRNQLGWSRYFVSPRKPGG